MQFKSVTVTFRAKGNMLVAWQTKLRGKQNLQTLAKFHGTLFIAVLAAVNIKCMDIIDIDISIFFQYRNSLLYI
jgi:hypothetical protein